MPVVLNFHGGLGSAHSQRRQSLMDRVADARGFLVVYPEGTGRVARRLLTFNAGRCCGYAKRFDVDDVGFVHRVLDDLAGRFAIDERRVCATGMSNGAMLAYRLACEMPERIAAIGPVAGTMACDGPRPGRPVPVLHVHGLRDENVLFTGGVGPNAIQKTEHRGIPEVLAWWREVNGCADEPAEVSASADCVLTRWAPPPGRRGAEVALLALPEGGHTWPGGTDVSVVLRTGKLVESVDASARIADFFERSALEPRGV